MNLRQYIYIYIVHVELLAELFGVFDNYRLLCINIDYKSWMIFLFEFFLKKIILYNVLYNIFLNNFVCVCVCNRW